jgi:FtsP/CotA-like multicopper oxidase with cupredoxin domain
MQHPIHFHGQRFLVLTTNGVKTDNFVWKDTTLIQKGDTVEILVDMENPGTWMAHCHIAEHLESGMMFNFRVNSAVFMHN